MKTPLPVAVLAGAALVLSAACSALAQVYTLQWSTLNSGGGAGISGPYEVSTTLGQSGAGPAAEAGHYSLASGFWVPPSDTSTNTGIRGTLRFSNANPAILDLLHAPGNEGMQSYFITAASRPPAAAVTATTPDLPATGLTSSLYAIAVAGSPAGVAYSVTPRVTIASGAETYYFSSRTSALVTASGPPITLDFTECLGVVTVRFVNSAGNPAPVDGGQILVTGATTRRFIIAPGSTQARMYLHGDTTEPLNITVSRGTDPYRDRLTFVLNTNVATVCDGFRTVDMFVPEPGALGRIEGQVDMLGEFELTVDGLDSSNLPDSTGLIAFNGPFQNQRWTALFGNNTTVPSSGAFVVSNVAPSTLAPVPAGYTVYAQMYFRTNRAIESFRSPALGSGSNASLIVGSGQVVTVTNLFVIQPGSLRGTVILQGPLEIPGSSSLFRGLNHASDVDANRDGIPDLLGSFGLYWTSLGAEGVNRRAPGATWTAAFGAASADFDGSLDPATGIYRGTYQLVLGGLGSQPSYWNPRTLNLRWSNPAGPASPDYYDNSLTLIDRNSPDVLMVSGQTLTRDVGYCFGEVRLVIQSSSGRFYAPEVRATGGGFAGTDFRGQPANYGVTLNLAAGAPTRAADAAARAELVMYLPQGSYRLSPSVIYTGNNQTRTGLAPIDVTVGCQERIIIGDALHQMTSASIPSPGTISFAIQTEIGHTYQVERATQCNPANWEPVGAPIVGTGNPITVLQEIAAGSAQAFFRIRFLD